MTLLEQAKTVQTSQGKLIAISDEEIELALAWIKDQIKIVQIMSVRNTKSGNDNYSFLARALREAFRRGKLDVAN